MIVRASFGLENDIFYWFMIIFFPLCWKDSYMVFHKSRVGSIPY